MRIANRHRRRIGRTATGVFAVVWLALVAQPCVMALEAFSGSPGYGPIDCPHCPDQQTGHRGSDDSRSGPRCDYMDGFDCDGRMPDTEQPVFFDSFFTVVSDTTTPAVMRWQAPNTPPSLDAACQPGRFTLQFCVFLK